MAESVAGVVNEYENVDGNVLAKLLAGMPDPQIRYAQAALMLVSFHSVPLSSLEARGHLEKYDLHRPRKQGLH